MEFLFELWLPVVVSAAFVWIVSFITHMVLPHHKGEYKGVPDEGKLLGGLEGVPPGHYMFPWGTMADMKNPEFTERMKRGPCGLLAIWSGPVNMGRNLVLTLLFYLAVGVFVAYLGWHAIEVLEDVGIGAPYLAVFRVCGTAAFMAHGLGWMPYMIWYGGPKNSFWTYLFDSVVYALITAGTFG